MGLSKKKTRRDLMYSRRVFNPYEHLIVEFLQVFEVEQVDTTVDIAP